MSGHDLLSLAKGALAEAGEPEAEVFARARSRGVARFAIGALGQHMQLEESEIVVRVAKGTRLAEAKTSSLDHRAIVTALHNAARVATIAPEVTGFPGFASKDDDTSDFVSKENEKPPRRSDATAKATAEDRVALLAPALASVKAKGFTSAGVLETSAGSTAVATTRGCAESHDDSIASYRVWALETAGFA